MDTHAFPAIPQAIETYYQGLLKSHGSHPLLQAIKRQGEERTWQGINELFRVTAESTALNSGRLLRELGFDDKNFDPDYLQAIFGIMRAINMLHSVGFSQIRPLRPQRSRRECDLLGDYDGTRYAIEVLRSSEAAYRFPEHKTPAHNLENYIAQRFIEKRSQLDATMKAHQCSKTLLVVVMDSPPAKQLTGSDEWDSIVNKAFELMGKPVNTHLFVFTGLQDIRTGKDEWAIYPPLLAWRELPRV